MKVCDAQFQTNVASSLLPWTQKPAEVLLFAQDSVASMTTPTVRSTSTLSSIPGGGGSGGAGIVETLTHCPACPVTAGAVLLVSLMVPPAVVQSCVLAVLLHGAVRKKVEGAASMQYGTFWRVPLVHPASGAPPPSAAAVLRKQQLPGMS